MDKIEEFKKEVQDNIEEIAKNKERLFKASNDWVNLVSEYKYSYNFTWFGRPIIQLPQDLMAMQEIIWKVKPDVIIETGVAHGGSIIFYSSILEAVNPEGCVIGIDIDIRKHNRVEIEKHPMFKRIKLIEGSSVSQEVVNQVKEIIGNDTKKKVLVCLDSYHTHEHVLEELKLYSEFVEEGCYIVVFDTSVAYLTNEIIGDRPWSVEKNPKSAVDEFLKLNSRFEVDREYDTKLLITACPGGYLKCIK